MKKEDLIIGRWYRNSNWCTDEDYIGRLSSFPVDNNTFRAKEYIYRNSYRNDGSYFSGDFNKIIEVSIEEIRHLLPPNHADLNLELIINNFNIW